MSDKETKERAFIAVSIAVLTISDTRTLLEDDSGDLLVQKLENAGHQLVERSIC